MLKIKDNVDLKELEKYGFELSGNFGAIKRFYDKDFGMEEDTLLVVEFRVIWLIENGAKESNERYFGNPQLDTLYDLIKDGLVEKVEE
jgi:hypothetical protein